MPNIAQMEEKHKSDDRHEKGSRQARIKKVFVELVDQLASERATSFAQEVNRAVREALEKAGRWPLKKGES